VRRVVAALLVVEVLGLLQKKLKRSEIAEKERTECPFCPRMKDKYRLCYPESPISTDIIDKNATQTVGFAGQHTLPPRLTTLPSAAAFLDPSQL